MAKVSKQSTGNDEIYMRKALELAEKGGNSVSPNPMVGCVIVKNGKITGSGFHGKFGGPHAEIEALNNCRSPQGATMYVNLEPCCHSNKKTAPCVPRIINAGIKKVVIAMKDPNKYVNGKGIKQLKAHGIKCETGVLENEARSLNEAYIKFIKTGLPFVTLKMAYSLDGRHTSASGDSRWISSEESRNYVHFLRSRSDAVMVGINTVLNDDPLLTSHGAGRNPVRVVLDTNLRIPYKAKVLDSSSKTIIATSSAADSSKKSVLKKKGIIIVEAAARGGMLDIGQVLRNMPEFGVYSVLVEGGRQVADSFIKAKRADKVIFFICPKLIGPAARMNDAAAVKEMKYTEKGSDIMIEGYPDV
jgi:diaminohydroxyphosphoribosylaminopyrimidine deaminase/5-amino-6-(5-phosphoribosylamino)uracil reductase